LAPQYFLAVVGFLYATGFLVVMAFLDRYGIRESSNDIWRARYIHIGILVLAFPVILNATVFSLLHVIKKPRKDLDLRQMAQRIWPIIILVVNVEIACFIMIMLTRGGQPGRPAVGIFPLQSILGAVFFGVPIILVIDRAVTEFIKRFSKTEQVEEALKWAHKLTTILRWILVPVVLALDIWFLVEFVGHLGGISLWLVGLYVAFGATFGIMIRTMVLYEHRPTHVTNVYAYRTMIICLMLPLYYLMLLAYAYGVFPYIPAPRGGGDYTQSPRIVVQFDRATTQPSAMTPYLDPAVPAQTKPLILVEETNKGLYLADPNEAGGPAEWRTVGGRKPRLLFVNYDDLLTMEFEARSKQ